MSESRGYAILMTRDGPAIHCRACGIASWNPDHVARLYCPNCRIYHNPSPIADELTRIVEGHPPGVSR